MKKINIFTAKSLLLFLAVFVIGGCAEIDKDFNPGGTSVGFSLRTFNYPTFFVEGEPTSVLPIRFLLNDVPSQPVTLNYTITATSSEGLETAAPGVQYNDPNNGSITIPAGADRYQVLNLELIAAGFPAPDNRVDTYVITFTPGTDYEIGSIGYTSTTAVAFRQCEFVIGNYIGTASITDAFNNANSPYDVEISQVNANTLRVTGYRPNSIPDATDYSWTFSVNATTGVITIPHQIYTLDDLWDLGYTNWAVQGNGTFDFCNDRVSLNVTHTVDAGSYGVRVATITWP